MFSNACKKRSGKPRTEHLLMDGTTFEAIKQEEGYKYLGFHQSLGISQKETKEQFKNELIRRVRIILASKLTSKNLFTALNTWAIP